MHKSGLQLLESAGVELVRARAESMAALESDIAGCCAVITRNLGLSAQAIEAGVNLQVIGNHGVGVDKVDVACATALGIPVVYTPGANAQAVAEHAILLALAVARRLVRGHQAVSSGDWGVRYTPGAMELRGKTLGVAGFGAIGRAVAHIAANGLGMRVLVFSPFVDAAELAALGYREADSLEALLGGADIVTLHRPSEPGAPPVINRESLKFARPGGILINTARADLVDDDALHQALESGQLAGAGLDVFTQEPPDPQSPLVRCDKVVLTPHVGASTDDALERMSTSCAQQVLEVLQGRRPPFLANPGVWAARRAATVLLET